jgi:hypothetical protein
VAQEVNKNVKVKKQPIKNIRFIYGILNFIGQNYFGSDMPTKILVEGVRKFVEIQQLKNGVDKVFETTDLQHLASG